MYISFSLPVFIRHEKGTSMSFLPVLNKSQAYMYSGTCAIPHLSFQTSCDIWHKFMVSKYIC